MPASSSRLGFWRRAFVEGGRWLYGVLGLVLFVLAHEGRSVVYISKQLGHGADVSLDVYQHVIDELEDRPALAAEVAIREAREERRRKLGS